MSAPPFTIAEMIRWLNGIASNADEREIIVPLAEDAAMARQIAEHLRAPDLSAENARLRAALIGLLDGLDRQNTNGKPVRQSIVVNVRRHEARAALAERKPADEGTAT